MHGRACEERKRVRHMLTVPSRATASVNTVGSSSLSLSSPKSFLKDGRKISVGDCALFKPPVDCPPFIGIIRSVAAGKEDRLKLGVNWLYRPAEVKLGKGILLEAAPNEIFYSFHKDEIPAASILHPCKVTFLPKGVELPSGICSFVCRRVYDITNKCLWWLTDQDYIDERQEEVDQLLNKTRLDMHATLQPGGRSPKPVNGSTSTSQLKPGSDSVQNSSSSYPSQAKGKKRERLDQGSEPVKRERISRMEDNESSSARLEGTLRSELAKITEKGGLVDSEGVEKLVQLMLPERYERKIDLTCRSMLAGVVAATDKFDCLSRFVQLRGLPVFDEWLQEIHKGRIGDCSPKDGDRPTEDFLLILLRALDKLPINLNALQMCNIGKSVNHLRTHKNIEVQRKARSLVDTWKKRVEAEMDAKSASNQGVSWPSRTRPYEASHGGNRHSGGSSDLTTKTSSTHVAASRTTIKLVQSENNTKSASLSPGSLKSAPSHLSGCTNLRDGQSRNTAAGGVSESSLAPARDEKSSSSSQSHNNSQSCSSDHGKTGGFCGKEDARSSTAGSMSVNKSSSGSSRHWKFANGMQVSSSSTTQRETASSRNSFQQGAVSEKLPQSALTCEKASDLPTADGNRHKLTVKLPNRGRSPGPSASGGSLEDPAVMNSRASSPVLSEKHDQHAEKADTYQVNISSDVNNESWQSNDIKDVLTGSDEGAGSPSAVPEEEQCKTVEPVRRPPEVAKASSPYANEYKSGKLNGGSFSSINALIESCAKFSETTSMAVEDVVGMNLLASVAAGEISKSDVATPASSPQADNNVVEHSCTRNDICQKSSPLRDAPQNQSMNGSDGENDKQHLPPRNLRLKVAEHKNISNPDGESGKSLDSSGKDLLQSVGQCFKSNVELKATSADVPSSSNVEKSLDEDRKAGGAMDVDTVSDMKHQVCSSLLTDGKAIDSCLKVGTEAVEVSVSHKFSENDCCSNREQKPSVMVMTSGFSGGKDDAHICPGSGKDLVSGSAGDIKTEKTNEMVTSCNLDQICRTDGEGRVSVSPGEQVVAGSVQSATNCKTEHAEENLDANEVKFKPAPLKVSSPIPVKEIDPLGKLRESRLSNAEADEGEECTSVTRDVSSVSGGGSDVDPKVGFDLNEGFSGDDGRNGDLNNFTGLGSSLPQFASPVPLPATITVAAAAKGPFVPPEDLLRNKGALGWKGSAATSAFRPAEPRKFLEIPHGTNTALTSSDATAGKQNRPPLDIDLNVPDERVLEDLVSQTSGQVTSSLSDPLNNYDCLRDRSISAPDRSSGGLDLDLNKVEEPNDMGSYASNSHRLDTSFYPRKSSSGARINEAAVGRDFDLNNGPAIDDMGSQPSIMFNQHARIGMPSQPALSGIRVNGSEMGNYSSWFPGANTYSAVTIPSIMPDRPEQPFPIVSSVGTQRMLNPAASPSSLTPDVYRAPVLSSSQAVPFQSTPFQYPMFPFGTSFSLPSATFSGGTATYVDSSAAGRLCFPGANAPLLGPALSVPSNYPRPYVVSLQDGTNSAGSESSRKWLRQGLDLNAGPGAPEQDARDEASSLALRQLSGSGPQTLTEEQVRMYQISGSILKRKEPDGGWDGFKQSSWQ